MDECRLNTVLIGWLSVILQRKEECEEFSREEQYSCNH